MKPHGDLFTLPCQAGKCMGIVTSKFCKKKYPIYSTSNVYFFYIKVIKFLSQLVQWNCLYIGDVQI